MKARNSIMGWILAILFSGWSMTVAAFTLELQSSASQIQLGQGVEISLMAKGLIADAQALRAYDVNIGFDAKMPFIRGEQNAGTRGFELGDFNTGESIFDWSLTATRFNGAQVSLLDDAELRYRQSDAFEVLRLVFLSTVAGIFDFSLNVNSLAGLLDPNTGLATDLLAGEPSIRGVSVTVGPTVTPVPEPGSAVLVMLALSALLFSLVWRRPGAPVSSRRL